MGNRFAIFAAVTLLALSPTGSARASPTNPPPDVRPVPTVHLVQSAPELGTFFGKSFDLTVTIAEKASQGTMFKETLPLITVVSKFHFDDRSTGLVSVSSNPLRFASKPYTLIRRSNTERSFFVLNHPFIKGESLVRRRCRTLAERHAAHACDIITTNRREIA